MPHIRAIIVAIFLLSKLALAEDWPQFRGPSGQGISSGHPNGAQVGLADGSVRWVRSLVGKS